MLQRSNLLLHYRARLEFDQIRPMMRGRAKLERKIGIKQMSFMMKMQTKYRVELESYWRKTVVRKGVDSAAVEHGTGWAYIKNDLARQNVALLPTAQSNLAKYEPLAFRALMELCSSRIAPPTPPKARGVPAEAYVTAAGAGSSHPAATAQLVEKVEDILSRKSTAVEKAGPKSTTDWIDAWKQFETVDPKKRLQYRK